MHETPTNRFFHLQPLPHMKPANSRRNFFYTAGTIGAGVMGLPVWSDSLLDQLQSVNLRAGHYSPEEFARTEEFWYLIHKAYRQSPHFINLENGYFSPQPVEVLQAQTDNIAMINEIPSFYMRRRQFEEKAAVKKQLATLAGCTPEEIVITRNTTESLDTIIAGIDFAPGDEAIMCDQDYGSMLEAFEQQGRRRGLVNKFVELPLHPESDEAIVSCYEKAITDKTKIILVTHLINISGQVLPIRKIADMAHRYGVEVLCDGAHAFAQLDFKIPDLNCDYYGASLHKWLCTPLGAGILYVRKEKIAKVWPLFGDTTYPADDIRKFEHIGTHPVSTNLTIANAIRFHQTIGAARKEARLKYLKSYWTEKVKDTPGIILNTPFDPARHGAIANVGVTGMTPNELADQLYHEFNIFTVAINNPSVKGVRITPHLYTRLEDLDTLVLALNTLSRR